MYWLNEILQMQRENHHDLDQELTRMLVDIQLLDILDIVDIVSEGWGPNFAMWKKQWKIDSKFNNNGARHLMTNIEVQFWRSLQNEVN